MLLRRRKSLIGLTPKARERLKVNPLITRARRAEYWQAGDLLMYSTDVRYRVGMYLDTYVHNTRGEAVFRGEDPDAEMHVKAKAY